MPMRKEQKEDTIRQESPEGLSCHSNLETNNIYQPLWPYHAIKKPGQPPLSEPLACDT